MTWLPLAISVENARAQRLCSSQTHAKYRGSRTVKGMLRTRSRRQQREQEREEDATEIDSMAITGLIAFLCRDVSTFLIHSFSTAPVRVFNPGNREQDH